MIYEEKTIETIPVGPLGLIPLKSCAELGEKVWNSIFSSVDSPDVLVDRDSRYYKANGCAYMEYDARELLIGHPEAMVLPVLRNRGKARAGWDEGFVEELS